MQRANACGVGQRAGDACRTAVLLAVLTACGAQDEDTTIVVSEVARCLRPRPAPDLAELPFSSARRPFIARHPLAEVTYGGGPVLRAPRVVGVFFEGEPLRKQTIAFLASYGCTEHFRSAVNEYGVGDARYLRTIVLPAYPALEPDEENPFLPFERWIGAQAKAGAFGKLEREDIVMVFVPDHVEQLEGFGGYHGEAWPDTDTIELSKQPARREPRPDTIVYAVVYFSGEEGRSGLDFQTFVASHELIEAATDPYPFSAPAWIGLSHPHGLIAPGVYDDEKYQEVADLCAEYHVALDYPFVVSHAYSNRRARAGQHPCSESLSIPYLVAPHDGQPVDLALGEAEVSFDVFVEDPDARIAPRTAYVGASENSIDLLMRSSSPSYGDGDLASITLQVSVPWYVPDDLVEALSRRDNELRFWWCLSNDCTLQTVALKALPPILPLSELPSAAGDAGATPSLSGLGRDASQPSPPEEGTEAARLPPASRLRIVAENFREAHRKRRYYPREACLVDDGE